MRSSCFMGAASKMVDESIRAMADVTKKGVKSSYHPKDETYCKSFTRGDAKAIKSVLDQLRAELASNVTATCDYSECKPKDLASTECKALKDINFCNLNFTGSQCTGQAVSIIHE